MTSPPSAQAFLDKDSLTHAMVERLLVSLDGDPHDRHTELCLGGVRPLEVPVPDGDRYREKYVSGLNTDTSPQTAHITVDNRLGAAISPADQTREMLKRILA